MWLKQFQVFQYSFDFQQDLAPRLEQFTLSPCPAHARMSHGWKRLNHQELSLNINNFHYCLFGKEERILPTAVIQNELEKRAENQGQVLKRHEKQQLKQDVEFDLLPKAFCIQKKTPLLFDQKRQRLFIESTSPQQLEMILAYLHKTLGQSVSITPYLPTENLNALWQKWLDNPAQLPHYLQFADRMQWIDADNPQKQIRCQGLAWGEEQPQWLTQGFIPKELSFIWRERIQFNLNSKLQFKRLQALEDFAEHEVEIEDQEAELLILGKQLQQLLDDLDTVLISKQNLDQLLALEH